MASPLTIVKPAAPPRSPVAVDEKLSLPSSAPVDGSAPVVPSSAAAEPRKGSLFGAALSAIISSPIEALLMGGFLVAHASFLYTGYVSVASTPESGRASILSDLSPLPAVGFPAAYLLFVVFLGRRWMKEREAMNPLAAITLYNAYTAVLSGVMLVLMVRGLYQNGALLWTAHVGRDYKPPAAGSMPFFATDAAVLWLNYQSKFLEMWDTVFFVLKKKEDQVSTLHVVHHAEMGLFMYVAILLNPFANGLFGPGINCAIHVVMYSYYFATALGFSPWWKKYLYMGQMAQFSLNALHSLVHMMAWNLRWGGIVAGLQLFVMLQMLYMFSSLNVAGGGAEAKKGRAAAAVGDAPGGALRPTLTTASDDEPSSSPASSPSPPTNAPTSPAIASPASTGAKGAGKVRRPA